MWAWVAVGFAVLAAAAQILGLWYFSREQGHAEDQMQERERESVQRWRDAQET